MKAISELINLHIRSSLILKSGEFSSKNAEYREIEEDFRQGFHSLSEQDKTNLRLWWREFDRQLQV